MGIVLNCSHMKLRVFLFFTLVTFDVTASVIFDFSDEAGLVDASQGSGSPANYSFSGGKLNFQTNPDSDPVNNPSLIDRPKVASERRDFAVGSYWWTIDLPEIGADIQDGDQTSVGAFIFSYDEILPGIFPELDFEIGYGNSTDRANLSAASDDLVVYVSSQFEPSLTNRLLIKHHSTHDFRIDLTTPSALNGDYYAEWFIDDVLVDQLNLNFGPDDATFAIFSSLENLFFIGDNRPTTTNAVQFESMSFIPIPEPSSLVLMVFGGLVIFRRKRYC